MPVINSFTLLPFWAVVLTLCALALFINTALQFRVLVLTRQKVWKYLLLLLPLVISVWSAIVAFNSLSVLQYVESLNGLHITREFLAHIYSIVNTATYTCMIWTVITGAVFALMLFIEHKTMPRVERTPLWVQVRMQSFRHW